MPSQAIETLDYLASLFVELERRAAKLYDEAYGADFRHEQLRERLIEIARDIGRQAADGSRVLMGKECEIRLSFGASSYFAPHAVTSFRYALIRHKVAKGILPEIFRGTVSYQFRESAKRVLDSLKLPDHLLAQYESCRQRTEILRVSPISALPAND